MYHFESTLKNLIDYNAIYMFPPKADARAIMEWLENYR